MCPPRCRLREYKSTPYVDLGSLAYKHTTAPSKRGFNSTGPRPSAITQQLLDGWTTKENQRCMTLMEKTGVMQRARETLRSRQVATARRMAARGQRIDPYSTEARAGAGGSAASSRPSSRASSRRPESARPRLTGGTKWSLGSSAESVGGSRAAEDGAAAPLWDTATPASVRSASGRRIFNFDRVVGEDRWAYNPREQLKDKGRERRYGLIRPSSATIGEGARRAQAQRPSLGKSHTMAAFFDPVSKH